MHPLSRLQPLKGKIPSHAVVAAMDRIDEVLVDHDAALSASEFVLSLIKRSSVSDA
jgi:hypothetical protein